jgi:hypothetical protein
MSFVNEYISEADIERFDLRKTERKYGLSHLQLHWAVDRAHDVYLRRIGSNKEVPGRELFEFFFDGRSHQIVLDVKIVREAATKLVVIWTLVGGAGSDGHTLGTEGMATLASALTEYRYRGIMSPPGEYEVKFVSTEGNTNV